MVKHYRAVRFSLQVMKLDEKVKVELLPDTVDA